MRRALRAGAPLSAALLVAVFALAPILWMVATSFKPPGEYVSTSLRFWPRDPTLTHYRELFAEGFLARLWNSLVVTAGSTALAILAAFPAAYALARLRFPARLDAAFLLLVLIVKLLPPIVVAVPLFQILRGLGLLDSLPGLILAYQVYTLPFAIWMLLGFVREVPWELEEAAMLDGAGLARRLLLIVAPVMRAGIAATAVFVAVLAWNEFLFALLFIQTPSRFTLPVWIATFITEDETFWGKLMGIGLLSSLPVMLVVGYLQRWLVTGFGGTGR